MLRKVPFFEYPRLWLDDRDEFIKIIDEVSSSGGFIMQEALSDFEENLSEYVGSNYSIGVANATDAMEIFLQAIGLDKGDEVIISSHTMLATASAVIANGGIPVPVDIGHDNLIDPDSITAAITPKTVGIMPTQLNGRTCNMDPILKIAENNGLFIVEDAAQALGSRYKNKSAGTFGSASCISFFPAKVLGCLGDAGAIITNDEELFRKSFQIHDHGRDLDGEIQSWGRNSRLDNLQAAILNHKLKTYDEVIKRRRDIAEIYQQELCKVEQLILPPGPNDSEDHFDVYQNYELQAENRDGLVTHLGNQQIGTLIQWGGKAVHQWSNLGFSQSLPRTERFFDRCLMIPMNIFISDDDVYYVCDQIKKFYE
ncbi:DegT/DnrJ/EryC1/StrS family aminotransferase [Gammaproteobacteria bacterium]|nr:DegT/DnrJ/EryC1/StrS family aminotransferase [Gammaproteobacteria bacterium]